MSKIDNVKILTASPDDLDLYRKGDEYLKEIEILQKQYDKTKSLEAHKRLCDLQREYMDFMAINSDKLSAHPKNST